MFSGFKTGVISKHVSNKLSPSCCANNADSSGCGPAMTAPVYFVDGSPVRDPLFTAVISERMRVPDRLRVTQAAAEDLKARAEDLPPAFSMHVPDRLALTGEESCAESSLRLKRLDILCLYLCMPDNECRL